MVGSLMFQAHTLQEVTHQGHVFCIGFGHDSLILGHFNLDQIYLLLFFFFKYLKQFQQHILNAKCINLVWSFCEENNSLSSSIKRPSHFLKFSTRLAMLAGFSVHRGITLLTALKFSIYLKTFLCIHRLVFVVTGHISYYCAYLLLI